MLQKYFPILSEVNSPLVALQVLGFTAASAEVAIKGISNQVLETLLKEAIEETSARKQEVEISASELEAERKSAAKAARYYRYRAAQAARNARSVSRLSRQVKAVRRPVVKASLKGLKGLSIDICRSRAVASQAAVRSAAVNYNTALQAVETTIQGGDIRTIRTAIAALKAAVRELEVAHLEFRFAREMLNISLARHSA